MRTIATRVPGEQAAVFTAELSARMERTNQRRDREDQRRAQIAALEQLAGGSATAKDIRFQLAGCPRPGEPPYSFPTRAGYVLRTFKALRPKNPRAGMLYRIIADLTKADANGRPKRVTVSHKRIAEWIACSTRQVSRYIRELEFAALPLISSTPGKQGRSSSFLFVVDPFEWAIQRDEQQKRVQKNRQERKTRAIAAAWQARERGELTDEQVQNLTRRATRQQNWRLSDRFKARLQAAG